MELREKDHPLSLKVMRLTKPSLFTGVTVGCDARDLPGDHLNADIRADMAIPSGLPNTGVGHMLLLPQSFGNIYLGEVFSSCVCVFNNSKEVVKDVIVKAHLQMSNQRVPLLGEGEDAMHRHVEANQMINEVIQHEIKDIGTHILVCAVHYTNAVGEPTNFRKFYKFQVMKPLDVKTKFYNAESDEVYLEAGIQNITSGPIFLEKVELEPSPNFIVKPIKTVDNDISLFSPINVVNPHDTRQYLYCLKLHPDKQKDIASLQQSTGIGKLDIVWRINLGDRGRLQTSQLQRTVPQYGDIKVAVDQVPNIVPLEEEFSIVLNIKNVCERELTLHLKFFSGKDGTEWQSVTTKILDSLAPGQNTLLNLSLIPLRLGLQTIAGISLTDTFLKRTYEYVNLAQVFVTNETTEAKKEFFSNWINQPA